MLNSLKLPSERAAGGAGPNKNQRAKNQKKATPAKGNAKGNSRGGEALQDGRRRRPQDASLVAREVDGGFCDVSDAHTRQVRREIPQPL